MATVESDICIIGGGITSAMLAQKLSALKPNLSITVIEAGRSISDVQNRGHYRQRALDYGEHPWPDDFIEDQQGTGTISMTMAVGGLRAALGRRVQPVFGGGSAAQVDVRPRGRLAARVEGAREVLL